MKWLRGVEHTLKEWRMYGEGVGHGLVVRVRKALTTRLPSIFKKPIPPSSKSNTNKILSSRRIVNPAEVKGTQVIKARKHLVTDSELANSPVLRRRAYLNVRSAMGVNEDGAK